MRALYAASVTAQHRTLLAGAGVLAGLAAGVWWLFRRRGGQWAVVRSYLQFDPRAVTFVGRRGNPPPQRGHFAVGAGVYLAIVAAGSLWAVDLSGWTLAAAWEQFVRHPWGTDPHRRFEWVGSFLVFVPVGVLALAAATLDRAGALRRFLLLLGVVAGLAIFSTVLELLQAGAAQSAVSRNDVLAQMLGCGLGIFVWSVVGPGLVGWVRRQTAGWRPRQPIDWLLAGYLLVLLVSCLMPFDFIIHPRDLYYEFNSGMVELAPFGGVSSPGKWAAYAVLFVPVGAWAATFGTRATEPVRSVGASALVGLIVAGAIEFVQIFVKSRSVELTQVILATLGAAAGAWLMAAWGVKNPVLSPVPTASRPLRRLRWTATAASLAFFAFMLYLAWQEY